MSFKDSLEAKNYQTFPQLYLHNITEPSDNHQYEYEERSTVFFSLLIAIDRSITASITESIIYLHVNTTKMYSMAFFREFGRSVWTRSKNFHSDSF